MKKFTILSVMLFGLGCMTTFAQSFKVIKTDGTTYEFKTSETSSIEFTEGKTEPKPETGSHEAVDLGLSVKWAKCNVGANSPEEYGEYFAWGEIEPKETYSMRNYKFYIDYSNTYEDADGFEVVEKYDGYTKYGELVYSNNMTGEKIIDDGRTILEREDDAAYMNWGGKWRMPTEEELEELDNKCEWKWATLKGVTGYKVVGPNGNYIFLPAAGYRGYSGLNGEGWNGYYWSSTLSSGSASDAYHLFFSGYNHYVYGDFRSNGYTVRPVSE